MSSSLIVQRLGLCEYAPLFSTMKHQALQNAICDTVWLCQHFPVFTQGQSSKPEHILQNVSIPIVQTDRGGQVTYHGPGQMMLYPFVHLAAKNLSVHTFVRKLEELILKTLEDYHISGHTIEGAPGVYVQNAKIASIGLRIKNGRSYHGVALNVDMDLKPFSYINPCGYSGLQMTQISDFTPTTCAQVAEKMLEHFYTIFDYEDIIDG